MNDHILNGCRTKPLSSYLKALGILRLISEQKDRHAKGWWHGETFAVRTVLNKSELESYFCDEYAPTPIVAPWNGGSGFYLGDARAGMEAITSCEQNRFTEYRNVISEIESWQEIPTFNTVEDVLQMLIVSLKPMKPGRKRDKIEAFSDAIKTEVPKTAISDFRSYTLDEVEAIAKQKDKPNAKQWKTWWNLIKKARSQCNQIARNKNKQDILPLCRAQLSESCVQWLDAVYAMQTDGQGKFNAILGTGGNEGRFEFSNNFMQRLAELFITNPSEQTRKLLASSIFNVSMSGLSNAKIGQYDPGRAGGYNQGMEVETKSFKVNPWDFVLTMEGALVMASAVVRRNPTEERSQFTAPFSVRFSSVGFSSSAAEETGRQEIWLPIWHRPATYEEIKHLFSEGRSTIARRVARTGLEFSRAVGTLGVDRGIDSFERYAFLERRGQSYVALPAGRVRALYKPKLELINELDPIIAAVDRFLRLFSSIPATFQSARKNIDERIFKCCQDPNPINFCALIRSIGTLEKLIAMRDRSKKPVIDRPLFGLSPLWIDYCDDNQVEVRIAAALASIRPTGNVGPLRSNMAEVKPMNTWRWSEGKGDRYWYGNSFPERLSGVLSRRLMDAERRSASSVPVEAFLPVAPQDVMAYLLDECDDTKIEDLLWGFTLINWRKPSYRKLLAHWRMPLSDHPLSRPWCVLKLLHSPYKIRDVKVKIEPRIAHLLLARRVTDACALAVQRLFISDLSPYTVSYQERLEPIRLLSSLLIPVRDQWKLEVLVLKDKIQTR